MSQPAKNSKLQKKKESTRLDTLFLITALREHAVSTFRQFRGCPHFGLERYSR